MVVQVAFTCSVTQAMSLGVSMQTSFCFPNVCLNRIGQNTPGTNQQNMGIVDSFFFPFFFARRSSGKAVLFPTSVIGGSEGVLCVFHLCAPDSFMATQLLTRLVSE